MTGEGKGEKEQWGRGKTQRGTLEQGRRLAETGSAILCQVAKDNEDDSDTDSGDNDDKWQL